MTEKDSKSGGPDWASDWLLKQAELVRSAAADPHVGTAGPMDETLRSLSNRWQEMGKAYLEAMEQAATNGDASDGETAVAGAPFKMGEEFLNVWRGAWSTLADTQAGAGPQLGDLLARLPPIGIAREHSETWRELLVAQAECQRLEHELRAVLARVQADALDLLTERLRERDQQRPITKYRELYDLWVECGEQVYAKVAHSPAYGKLQAELGNAALRVRTHQQKVLEQGLKQFDLPTRSELNTVHRQLREQREQLRELREQATGVANRPRAQPKAKAKARSSGRQASGPARAKSRKSR